MSIPIPTSPETPLPLTPLPPHVISSSLSPAWDPSSHMPERPINENIESSQSSMLIIKPCSKVNHNKNGYNHKEAMGLDDSTYEEIKVSLINTHRIMPSYILLLVLYSQFG